MAITDYRANTIRARDPKRGRRTLWILWWSHIAFALALFAWGRLFAPASIAWWIPALILIPGFVYLSWLLYSTRPSR